MGGGRGRNAESALPPLICLWESRSNYQSHLTCLSLVRLSRRKSNGRMPLWTKRGIDGVTQRIDGQRLRDVSMKDCDVAMAVADAGAAVVRRCFGTPLQRLDKGVGDFATHADI